MKPEELTPAYVEEHLLYQSLNPTTVPLWRHFLLAEVRWMGEASLQSSPSPYAAQVLSHPQVVKCRTKLRADERILRWVRAEPTFVARPIPGEPQRRPEPAFGFLDQMHAPFCPWCMRQYQSHMQFLVIPEGTECPGGFVIESKGTEL